MYIQYDNIHNLSSLSIYTLLNSVDFLVKTFCI